IVTVFPPVPDYLGSPHYDEIVAKLTHDAQQTAAMAAEQAQACGIENVRVEVLQGHGAESILRVAEIRGCDCIVVGSRGLGTMSGLLLGGVSDKLAHHSKVPVLIVK
ncbi:MAG: universal stress protein, partial [Chloroflexota bacterium]